MERFRSDIRKLCRRERDLELITDLHILAVFHPANYRSRLEVSPNFGPSI